MNSINSLASTIKAYPFATVNVVLAGYIAYRVIHIVTTARAIDAHLNQQAEQRNAENKRIADEINEGTRNRKN